MGNKTPQTHSATAETICWACHRSSGAGHLCQHCSVLQPLRNSETHFSVMGLSQRLNLDPSALQRTFYELSRNYHPDFYQTRTPEEKSISEGATAMINTAYETLNDPIRRVEYLLALEGMPAEQGISKPPMDLFEEILSVQEALGDYREAKLNKAPGLDQAKTSVLKINEDLEDRRKELEKRLEAISIRWDAGLNSSSTTHRPDSEEKNKILIELRATLGEIAYLRTVLRDIQKTIGARGLIVERVIGIDLGTTNSLAAYMEGGQPKIIPDLDGHRLVPSMITFTADGIVVGEQAKQLRAEHVGNTIYSVKRLMGKGITEVKAELSMAPFQVSDQSGEVIRITINQKDYTPPELSAMVLKKLKTQAENFFGEPVNQAVITVPAYFNDSQRQATKDAGQIAGLEVLRILNEPTAAALAYGLDKKRQGVIAVYDLGGGTFDISILKLNNGIFEVLATNGNTRLGGDDFDRAVTDFFLHEMESRYGSGIRQSPKLIERVRIATEKAKIELSSQSQTELVITLEDGKNSYRRTLARSEFEDLIRDFINKTVEPCRQAMADAKLTPDQIDEVLLVGGSTRIPLVQQTVKALFKKQPKCELNPDEVVALGAAVQAHILMGEIRDMLLLDVTPLSLGIETFGGIMSKLVERNSKVPTSAKETFTTFVEGQTVVDIHVLQGERELVNDNQSLARFALKGIPPMAAGIPRIEVSFHLDANGILNVSAKELRTGQEQSIEVKPTYGLSKTEVERMIRDSMVHAKSDLEARQLIESRNQAEEIIRAAEKALKDHAALIKKEQGMKITSALERLKMTMKGNDRNKLGHATQEVEALTRPLAEAIMRETVQKDLKGKKLSDVL